MTKLFVPKNYWGFKFKKIQIFQLRTFTEDCTTRENFKEFKIQLSKSLNTTKIHRKFFGDQNTTTYPQAVKVNYPTKIIFQSSK